MESGKLSSRERQVLLKIARESIKRELEGLPFTLPRVTDLNLLEHRGAFVTLHRHGQLRGCIGTFIADRPLYEIVGDMAISAAFNDPRFRPLSPSELDEIDLEVSALTPLRETTDLDEIQVGIHGIYIVNGPYRGVLLPQVATEYGWDRYTFLDQTCIKAGMAPGCWKDPNTKVYIFSAEVFGEKTEKD